MRFYLDECLSPRVLDPISAVYGSRHEFADSHSEGLTGTKDVPLFREMVDREVDVFITLDRAQLDVPEEVAGIRAGTCHWMGLKHPSGTGVSRIARTSATLLEAITYIIDNPPGEPTAYLPKSSGREHHQLFRRVLEIRLL